MVRYQVILAYDGTEFQGFQRQLQKPNTRTVQGVVEQALLQIGWQGQAILAAGRTDTGVHAVGQVIAFDLDWLHSTQELLSALNANLPPEVAAHEVKPARPDFHPRYDAIARRYTYRVFCREFRHPLRERYAWRVWPPVDLERLHQVAACLIGTHDFVAFGSPPHSQGSTVRCVYQANWRAEEDELVFEIQANAFLYRMVRRLVNFQVLVGQGRFEPEEVLVYLTGAQRKKIQGLAPPQGLCLSEVSYPEEAREAT